MLFSIIKPVFTVVSNYLIIPVVAFLPQGLGTLQLQASEVTEIILVPLQEFTDPDIYHTEEWTRAGRTRIVYFYDYGSYRMGSDSSHPPCTFRSSGTEFVRPNSPCYLDSFCSFATIESNVVNNL